MHNYAQVYNKNENFIFYFFHFFIFLALNILIIWESHVKTQLALSLFPMFFTTPPFHISFTFASLLPNLSSHPVSGIKAVSPCSKPLSDFFSFFHQGCHSGPVFPPSLETFFRIRPP